MPLPDADGVLFDVDGTLVDTTYLHAVCWSAAFAEAGLPQVTADLHHLIGMAGDKLVEEALGSDSLQEQLTEGHDKRYREWWSSLQPMPGARELLEHCHASGLRVVLASSAKAEELEALRKALDADQWMDAATSADDASEGKPAPDLVQTALSTVGLAPSRAVFVGDAVWDGHAAHAAGVPFVGLTCGGTQGTLLTEASATAVFTDPAALLSQWRA